MSQAWWAKGLLFENCNCQLVCPGHMSFKQACTHERCQGYWGIHFDEGRFGETALDRMRAVVVFDCPQHMIEGGWTTALYVDERASSSQREAIERILSGESGGPWAILARFVARRLETRVAPIHLEDSGRKKRMWFGGVLDTTVEAIRGMDRDEEARLTNLFNQIHAPVQVLARGHTRFSDHGLAFVTQGTHALYSRFSWAA